MLLFRMVGSVCVHSCLQQWSNWQPGKLGQTEAGRSCVRHCLVFFNRTDQNGRNGLQYVVEVILHLLDPILPEFSASYVGKLVVVFIQKVCASRPFPCAGDCVPVPLCW